MTNKNNIFSLSLLVLFNGVRYNHHRQDWLIYGCCKANTATSFPATVQNRSGAQTQWLGIVNTEVTHYWISAKSGRYF